MPVKNMPFYSFSCFCLCQPKNSSIMDGNKNTAYMTNTIADAVYSIADVNNSGVFLVRYPSHPSTTPKNSIAICGNTSIAVIVPAVVSISSMK